LFALCSMVTKREEVPFMCSKGWGVSFIQCRVWRWVRAAGFQRLLLVGVVLWSICSIRDKSRLMGSLFSALYSVVGEGGVGRVGGYAGCCGDGESCWVTRRHWPRHGRK